MKLIGYGDKLSVEPGTDINFMVSSEPSSYEAALIRLIHGDPNPAGPGFKYERVESELTGQYFGQTQKLRTGSYVLVPHDEVLNLARGSFTIHMWIRPAMPAKRTQTLISKVSPDGAGYALRLDSGRLTLQVGSNRGATVSLAKAVELHTWYSVTAVYDAESGEAGLWLDPLACTASQLADATLQPLKGHKESGSDDLVIAGELVVDDGDSAIGNFYNGKIDAPRLFNRALGQDEVTMFRDRKSAQSDGLVAAWDFSADISSSAITDTSANGLHGRTVNKPMRGATGWNWDGSETAWRSTPDQYGAIHFHDDDLDDANWERSLGWAVPDGMASGVYAVHLRADEDEDFIPFVVRPRRGQPTTKIAFLMPTFSYLAYANEHIIESSGDFHERMGLSRGTALDYPSQPPDKYIIENGLNSLYDRHTDGSGVCYSSRMRPIVNMRPKYVTPQLANGEGSPHQLNADLHLVDWLHERQYTFDVITDEDLHKEGVGLLEPYNVILTGSHHEYWSIEMIRAAQLYLCEGGRLMYLGGNGMYWVTQLDPETGHSIEIRRRGPSTRTWEPEPGEAHLSATGELGGLWRYRGYSPQSWLGVGFTAMSIGEGRPYDRQADSYDERASWIFDGIGDDEKIGDFPCLVNGYGAAGFELDRVDYSLGTPHSVLLLATAANFSDSYQHVSEEILMSDSSQGGTVNPLVRADMVLLEYPKGGAVFSPGSLSWCGCLSYNGYDNNVSQITRNVLDRFVSDE